MPELDRWKIADTLQRNASYIADSATQALGQLPFDLMGQSSTTITSGLPTQPGLGGEVTVLQSQDEVATLVTDGFRRLGSVVALSVLVDEPGLIADDLAWLEHMFGTRGFQMMNRAFLLQLTSVYVNACKLVLASNEINVVQKTVESAFSMLSSTDPSI